MIVNKLKLCCLILTKNKNKNELINLYYFNNFIKKHDIKN